MWAMQFVYSRETNTILADQENNWLEGCFRQMSLSHCQMVRYAFKNLKHYPIDTSQLFVY